MKLALSGHVSSVTEQPMRKNRDWHGREGTAAARAPSPPLARNERRRQARNALARNSERET